MSVDILRPISEPPSLACLPEDDIVLQPVNNGLKNTGHGVHRSPTDLFDTIPGKLLAERIVGPLISQERTLNSKRLRWMSYLDDSTPLSSLSIPGTTVTNIPFGSRIPLFSFASESPSGENHRVGVFRQLDAGIRALELWYTVKDGDLRLSFGHDGTKLIDILNGIKSWLDLHPSETIYISFRSLKHKIVDEPYAKNLLNQLLTNTSDFWVQNPTSATTLGQARGKFIFLERDSLLGPHNSSLLKRYTYNSSDVTVPWNSISNKNIEYAWSIEGFSKDVEQQIDRKMEYLVVHLERAQKAIADGSRTLWIANTSSRLNHDDSSLDTDIPPDILALGRGDVPGVNDQLLDWFKNAPNKPVGIVFLHSPFVRRKRTADFQWSDSEFEANSELVHLIIDQNFHAPIG
ncbi:hypothetical protein CPB86DRAFT_872799 [Serendipita vermifera]|nr:hypothetical protein CPB86DRAFT_872799 [Serendipita vermifera]